MYETETPIKPILSLTIRPTKPTTPKASEAFLQICKLETSSLFRCDCSFSYRREEKEVHFALPIKVEDDLFDEIRGIRLVKLQQDKILLENFMDLVEPNLMIYRIKFLHEGRCSADLPQKLLRQARTISRKSA
jgi:hypothetical protein